MSLSRALRANGSLRSLTLSLNPLGDSGVSTLADGLRYNHGLDTLCVNMCAFGNTGFARLLDAARAGSGRLRTVKLCYNDIGDVTETRAAGGDVREDLRHPGGNAKISEGFVDSNGILGNTKRMVSTKECDDAISDVTSCISDVITGNYDVISRQSSNIASTEFESRDAAGDKTPTLEQLYLQLREVLHHNPQLRMLLWGNHLDALPAFRPYADPDADPLGGAGRPLSEGGSETIDGGSWGVPTPTPSPVVSENLDAEGRMAYR